MRVQALLVNYLPLSWTRLLRWTRILTTRLPNNSSSSWLLPPSLPLAFSFSLPSSRPRSQKPLPSRWAPVAPLTPAGSRRSTWRRVTRRRRLPSHDAARWIKRAPCSCPAMTVLSSIKKLNKSSHFVKLKTGRNPCNPFSNPAFLLLYKTHTRNALLTLLARQKNTSSNWFTESWHFY